MSFTASFNQISHSLSYVSRRTVTFFPCNSSTFCINPFIIFTIIFIGCPLCCYSNKIPGGGGGGGYTYLECARIRYLC